LAAQKRNFGAYNDENGLRYQPPYFYLKLKDYTRGLSYMEWFDKNFPEDPYLPEFLFEWTILLYKTGKIKEAEKKASETLLLNADVFDEFFGNQRLANGKSKQLSVKANENLKRFRYSSKKWSDLVDFSEWLKDVEKSDILKSYLVDNNKDERKSSANPDIPNSEDKKLIYKKIKRMRRKLAKMAWETNRYGIDIYKIDKKELRYKLPSLYLSVQDYKGGLNYMRWFDKNFPEELCWPEFLFEWTIILYKNRKYQEAAQKVADTLLMNKYVLKKFFGRPIPCGKNPEQPDVEDPEFLEDFFYESRNQLELTDFSNWLLKIEQNKDFKSYLVNNRRRIRRSLKHL
jgi:hypothetical protein